jgi:hypothetical protein
VSSVVVLLVSAFGIELQTVGNLQCEEVAPLELMVSARIVKGLGLVAPAL